MVRAPFLHSFPVTVKTTAYLGIEFMVGLGYVSIGGWMGAASISARMRRRIDVGSGVCFLGMAGLLAADDLT